MPLTNLWLRPSALEVHSHPYHVGHPVVTAKVGGLPITTLVLGRGEGCISNFEVALFAPLAAIERRRELGTSLRISMSVDLGSLLGNSSGVESFVMTSLLHSPEMWWKLAHLALAVLPEEAKAALNVLELTR
jgi:hypothetical protein